jgi:hypothetical protein
VCEKCDRAFEIYEATDVQACVAYSEGKAREYAKYSKAADKALEEFVNTVYANHPEVRE